MSKKHNNVCKAFNYIENFLILAAMVIGHVKISAFISFVGISAGIVRSAVGIKICAINAVIKKYKSIIKKKKEKNTIK